MSGLVVVSSQLPRSAVALTVEKDPPREPVSEVAYVRNLLIRNPTGLPPTARYIPSESPSPPVTDTSLTTAMPPSDLRRDCQVNSGTLPHFEAAVVDLRRQRETTAKLVKQFLERLSPPQAENAKVPVQRSVQTPITIPAPSPPFAPSAPFISSNPVPVNRLALSSSTSVMHSNHPISSTYDLEDSEDFDDFDGSICSTRFAPFSDDLVPSFEAFASSALRKRLRQDSFRNVPHGFGTRWSLGKPRGRRKAKRRTSFRQLV